MKYMRGALSFVLDLLTYNGGSTVTIQAISKGTKAYGIFRLARETAPRSHASSQEATTRNNETEERIEALNITLVELEDSDRIKDDSNQTNEAIPVTFSSAIMNDNLVFDVRCNCTKCKRKWIFFWFD